MFCCLLRVLDYYVLSDVISLLACFTSYEAWVLIVVGTIPYELFNVCESDQ